MFDTLKMDTQVVDVLWHNALIGLAILDETGKFLHVNPFLCEMLSYTESELAGKNLREITHPADVRDDIEMLRRITNGEVEDYIMTKRFITKQETIVWVKMRVDRFITSDGRVLRYLSQICKEEKFFGKTAAPGEPHPTNAACTALNNANTKTPANHPVYMFLCWLSKNWKMLALVGSLSLSVLGGGVKVYTSMTEDRLRMKRIEQLLIKDALPASRIEITTKESSP